MDEIDRKARAVIEVLAKQNGRSVVDVIQVIQAAYERGREDERTELNTEAAKQDTENKCGLCLPDKPCNWATCPNDVESNQDTCAKCGCVRAGHYPVGCSGAGGNCGCTAFAHESCSTAPECKGCPYCKGVTWKGPGD